MEKIYYVRGSKNRRGKNTFIILSFFTVLFFLVFFLVQVATKKENPPREILSSHSTPLLQEAKNSKQLEEVVQNALIGTKGNYSIAIKNLKTGEEYYLNEHTRYDAASLYKLWVMAETFEQIKNGKLKENDVLAEDPEKLSEKFNIDPKLLELESAKEKVSLSVSDALEKMIDISDNYAALLLTSKIRLSNIASFLKINGFNESTVGSNKNLPAATAHDILLFFEKLYNKQLINDKYATLMLQLLKTQRLNAKIPKYLPKDIVVAHKTGELDEYTHDAGIVYAPNGEYIIVVLSKSDNPSLAANRISNVSEAVYNYFQNK